MVDSLSPTESTKPSKAKTKTNINTATMAQLTDLPGIGDSKAKAIIAYREQGKGFKSLDELMKVKGIGPKIYENLKEFITIALPANK